MRNCNLYVNFEQITVFRKILLDRRYEKLYSFIQGWFEWPFSALFSANVSLWNQYKCIALNTFSCRILIISHKVLIITGISNEKTNKLTIHGILCWNVTIFYQQELYFKCKKNWMRLGVKLFKQLFHCR